MFRWLNFVFFNDLYIADQWKPSILTNFVSISWFLNQLGMDYEFDQGRMQVLLHIQDLEELQVFVLEKSSVWKHFHSPMCQLRFGLELVQREHTK